MNPPTVDSDILAHCSLISAFEGHAKQWPTKVALTELLNSEYHYPTREITYLALYSKCQVGANWLMNQYTMGSKVSIYASPGIDAAITYFSVLLAGMKPVLMPTPSWHGDLPDFENINKSLTKTCPSCCSIISPQAHMFLEGKPILNKKNDGHRFVVFDEIFEKQETPDKKIARTDTINAQQGHIIFTSGTTSTAKPVDLSSKAIAFNLAYTAKCWSFSQGNSILALGSAYHSAGLMVGYLMPIYIGATAVIANQVLMNRDSGVLLSWLSEYQITHLACSDSIVDKYLSKNDLVDKNRNFSNWEKVIIGGEPLKEDTIGRFKSTLEQISSANPNISTAYGMTEAAGLITTTSESAPVELTLSIDKLTRGYAVASLSGPSRFVASGGRATHGVICVIVDDHNRQVEPNKIGKVLFFSPSLFTAYEGIKLATSYLIEVQFRDGTTRTGFFDTGDLGFSVDNKLVTDVAIIGRSKEAIRFDDAIIVAPDIEAVVEQTHPLLPQTLFVAIQDPRKQAHRPSCVIVCEVDDRKLQGEIATSVTAKLSAVYPKYSFSIIFTKLNALPKISTSSKKPRLRISKALEKGLFPIISEKLCESNAAVELLNS